MSIASLTTVGAVRDVRAPTIGDMGKAKPTDEDRSNAAKLKDLLVTQVPTEVVAPYTAVSAGIIGAIDKPTPENPEPDEFLVIRWIVFAVLVLTVFFLVWLGKRSKETSGGRFPGLEISGGVVAAVAWAFILPESPLTPYIDEEALRTILPLVIGFVGVMVNLVIAIALKNKAS